MKKRPRIFFIFTFSFVVSHPRRGSHCIIRNCTHNKSFFELCQMHWIWSHALIAVVLRRWWNYCKYSEVENSCGTLKMKVRKENWDWPVKLAKRTLWKATGNDICSFLPLAASPSFLCRKSVHFEIFSTKNTTKKTLSAIGFRNRFGKWSYSFARLCKRPTFPLFMALPKS